MKKKVTYGILSVGIVIAIAFGWQYVRYLASHIETDDAQVEGNIVPVLSRVGSYVSKIHVVDNQVVRAGDLLVYLDTADLELKVEQAEASYQSALSVAEVQKSKVEDARVSQELARTSVEEPKTNLWRAKSEYARYHDLYQQQLSTQQKLEEVKAAQETAQTQYDLALQHYESAKVQYKTAQDQLKVEQANVALRQKEIDFAKLQLSYSKVVAPVSGVVSKKSIQEGQLIQAGQPLMALVQNDQVWVVANYKETQLEGMNIGNEVSVNVDAYPDMKFKGKVESIGGATGAKFSLIPPDNAAGNFVKVVQRVSVRIALDEAPQVNQFLKPGLSVTTSIVKSR